MNGRYPYFQVIPYVYSQLSHTQPLVSDEMQLPLYDIFVFALLATKNYGMQMGYSYTVLVLYPLSSPALLTLRIG